MQDKIYLKDQQLWDLGITKVKVLLLNLTDREKTALATLLESYSQTKEAIVAIATKVDAASICLECGGKCCLNGKYRINVLDALAHVTLETPISVDFSQKPICPYGTSQGCKMGPALRPADCALFLCEVIDEKLSPENRRVLMILEDSLRQVISKASNLTGESIKTPLLLWAEKSDFQQN